MKAVKVNADYESVLFTNKEGPGIINESLEFLAFFLVLNPVFSRKQYRQTYLNYIEEITGHTPKTISAGAVENWWGPLDNLELERTLNTKEIVTKFNPDSLILTEISQIASLGSRDYLAKNPFGMSGLNFLIFNKENNERIFPLLQKSGKLLVEPLFKRVRDFSHYVFDDHSEIAYENLVDQNFQYKGTVFRNRERPTLESLSFYNEVSLSQWNHFLEVFSDIKNYCRNLGVTGGYSLDSFIYRDEEQNKVRSIAEINYRKTMGLIAWELSKKFCGSNSWSMLLLAKPSGENNHEATLQRIKSIAWNSETCDGCMMLSPGDTRFDLFLLSAKDEAQGKNLFQELKRLLVRGQLTVDI